MGNTIKTYRMDQMNIGISHDGGSGFNYTITNKGVLLAKGWLRVDLLRGCPGDEDARHVDAIKLVRGIAHSLSLT